MTEVTDVIVARQERREPFSRMLVWSLIAHVAIVGFLLFGPLDWSVEAEAPRTVMTISLAGAPGPRTGMTPMGGRAVPVPPPEAVPRAIPPPPPKPAERVVPTETRRRPPASTRL